MMNCKTNDDYNKHSTPKNHTSRGRKGNIKLAKRSFLTMARQLLLPLRRELDHIQPGLPAPIMPIAIGHAMWCE